MAIAEHDSSITDTLSSAKRFKRRESDVVMNGHDTRKSSLSQGNRDETALRNITSWLVNVSSTANFHLLEACYSSIASIRYVAHRKIEYLAQRCVVVFVHSHKSLGCATGSPI
jgi:hypothetical protein